MAETKDKVNGFTEIQELLDNKEGLYYSDKIAVVNDVKSVMTNEYNDKEVAKVFKLLGYKKNIKKIQTDYKFGKRRHFVWAKNLDDIKVEIERLRLAYSDDMV